MYKVIVTEITSERTDACVIFTMLIISVKNAWYESAATSSFDYVLHFSCVCMYVRHISLVPPSVHAVRADRKTLLHALA